MSGFVGYYLWEGENGDDDLKGIRYGTRLSFGEDGAQVELEFDSPEGSSKVKWGLQVSYLHKFGVPTSGAVETAERQFDPRDYFYDAVEREYAQKIRRSSGGGGWRAAVVGLTGNAATLYAQLYNDEVLATLVGEKELPYSFNMLVNTTLAIGKDIGASVLGGRDSFAMSLSAEPAVGSVTVSFIDEGRQLRLVPGTKVSLYHNGQRKPNIEYMAATIRMTLSPQQEQTDLQAWVGDDALDVLLYEGAVAFAQNNAASVLVLGREAEARVWTMDGVTVVGGCGSGKERKNFVDDNGVAINAKTYCAPIVVDPVGEITVSGNLPSSILLANISASGGSGNYRYSVVAGADFSFQGADLFLSPPNNIFYLLTATVEVSDDTGVSVPGTLVVTVARAIEAIMENSSGYYRVAHLEGRIIATLSPDAGRAPYSFVLEDGAGVFTLVAATDDLSAELHINAVAGPALFTVTVKINDQDINQGAIDSVFTVEVLPPIVIEPVGTITVNAGLSPPILLANISASGGSGNYRYSVVAGADFSFQGADLFLSPPSNFNLLTVTVEVSDGTGVSTPVLLVVTVVRAVGAIMANLSRASYTVAHLEGRIIETLSPVAGSPPYSFVLRDEAGEFGLATVGASAELRINAVAGPALFTATVEIKDTNQGAIDRIFTVSVLPPVAAQVVNAQRFQMFGVIDNSFKSVVATITPSGGNGNYEYRKIADATDSFSTPDSNGVLSITAVNAVGTQALQVTVEVRDTFSAARMATVAVAVTVAGLSFSPLTVTSGVSAAGNILIDYFAEIGSVSGCTGGIEGDVGEITGDSLPATKENKDIRDSFDSGRYGIMVSVNLAGSYVYIITVSARCGGKDDLYFSGAYRLDVAKGNSEVFVPLQELPANRTFTKDLQFRPPVFYIPPLRYTLVVGGGYRNNKDDAALFTMDDVNGMLMVSGGDERDGLYNNPYMLSVEISDSASQRLTTAVSVVLISLLVRATEADLRGVGINSVTATGEFSASSETNITPTGEFSASYETNNLSATEDFELFAKSRDGVRIDLIAGSTLALKSDDGSFIIVLDAVSGKDPWVFIDMPGLSLTTFTGLPTNARDSSGEQVIVGPQFELVANKHLVTGVWYCVELHTTCSLQNPAALSIVAAMIDMMPAEMPADHWKFWSVVSYKGVYCDAMEMWYLTLQGDLGRYSCHV